MVIFQDNVIKECLKNVYFGRDENGVADEVIRKVKCHFALL